MLTSSITVPHTYAEWVMVLDMLKKKQDDESALLAMQQGTLEWQPGVAERFTNRLIDVVDDRMKNASEKFQKELKNSFGQERVIVQSLLALRAEMKFLLKAVDLPAIPSNHRQQLQQLIIDKVNSMQTSLENSSKSDRSGKLRNIVRNNRVNSL